MLMEGRPRAGLLRVREADNVDRVVPVAGGRRFAARQVGHTSGDTALELRSRCIVRLPQTEPSHDEA